MVPKRDDSRETTERINGEAFEQAPGKFLIYVDTQLFIENESTLTW